MIFRRPKYTYAFRVYAPLSGGSHEVELAGFNDIDDAEAYAQEWADKGFRRTYVMATLTRQIVASFSKVEE